MTANGDGNLESTLESPMGETLWQGLEPGAHLVHFYEQETDLLVSLENYLAAGLLLGEGVIAIATTAHLSALRTRLRARGFDLAALQMSDQFIALDAGDLLERILHEEGPDPARFDAVIRSLLARGRGDHRRVRVFAELVSVLWSRGEREATVALERLWQRCCTLERVPLLCAYPMQAFSRGEPDAISEICAHHTSLLLP